MDNEEKKFHDWHITKKGVRVKVEGKVFIIPWGEESKVKDE